MRLWLGALLLATACDGGPAPSPARENPFQQRIAALDEGQRNAVFLRAIRDAGQDCQGVAGSAEGGVQFGMPSWVARCSDGRDWLIMLAPDGRAHVARREEKL
jgi:hypothetical protein